MNELTVYSTPSGEKVKGSEVVSLLFKDTGELDYGLLIAGRHRIEWDIESREKLLMSEPNAKWIRQHPFIKVKDDKNNQVPLSYVPADKVEFILDMLFPRKKISITGQGTAFNAVWVSVRVEVYDPIYKEWIHFDGTGAVEIQTKAGASASDLSAIVAGAVQKAIPAAKTYAIKDACDHLGNIFGRNIARNFAMTTGEVFQAERYAVKKDREGKVNFITNADSVAALESIRPHIEGDAELIDLYDKHFNMLSL